MYRIGIKFDDARFDGLDISDPSKGNPGIGGTAYEEILLAYHLSREANLEVYLFHTNVTNKLPEGIVDCREDSIMDIPRNAKKRGIDIFIFSAGRGDGWYDELQNLGIKSIAWAHCYLNYFELKKIRSADCIKRVIFVGREQYSAYIADDIIKKSDFAYNIFESDHRSERKPKGKRVVYLGSLYRIKGFHILAEAWKKILEKVPDAELYVIGNGKLYGREMKVGKYGLAYESYERKFMKYLVNDKGEIMESVHFLGILGKEKKTVMSEAMVGVANPSGVTETFCISAVEMEAEGVPICTTGKYGILDTVKNRKTGLYSYDVKALAENIVLLLTDEELNHKLGTQARNFVKKFRPEKIIPEWMRIFNEVMDGKEAVYIPTSRNHRELRIKRAIRSIRIEKGIKWFPSFIFFEFLFKGLQHEWARDIIRRYILKPELVND